MGKERETRLRVKQLQYMYQCMDTQCVCACIGAPFVMDYFVIELFYAFSINVIVMIQSLMESIIISVMTFMVIV